MSKLISRCLSIVFETNYSTLSLFEQLRLSGVYAKYHKRTIGSNVLHTGQSCSLNPSSL